MPPRGVLFGVASGHCYLFFAGRLAVALSAIFFPKALVLDHLLNLTPRGEPWHSHQFPRSGPGPDPLRHVHDKDGDARDVPPAMPDKGGNAPVFIPAPTIDHAANGLLIRTPRISCPSFKSSVYSTAAPVRAAATTTCESHKDRLAWSADPTAARIAS